MPDIALDDSDRALLRECPVSIAVVKGRKPTRTEQARMKRIKRLWAACLVHGDVASADHLGQTLRVTLTNAGRVAIGLPVQGASNVG